MNPTDEIEAQAHAPQGTATAATIDSSNRPDPAWLDRVEGEIDDVDRVLKCLARDSATMCTTCHALRAEGALDARPVLVRCASSKQPR